MSGDDLPLMTVKVDRDTHRLIGDLAHLTGRTRKAVVRDAMQAYAAWRERQLDEGVEAAASRVAIASVGHSARLVSGELGTVEAERIERSRIGAAKMSPRVRAQMSSGELFELQRDAVTAAFVRLGARPLRMADDPMDYGYPPGDDVIVVEMDRGARFDQLRLAAAAFNVLTFPCSVVTEDWRR
ncbi:CopG family ribbon-helix-helix protein [Agromyces soli]